jgi:hypothetical protein
MNTKQFYQGDISIIKIKKSQLPKNLIFKKLENDFIVARGEATGHTHKLVKERVEIEIAQDQYGYYIKTNEKTTLEHQKHGQIDILPGITFIGHQVEYDELEEIKRVQD